jgi:DNA primase
VGNTARKITDGRPKYLSDQTPGYVFNLDSQPQQRKFVIVVEGPMDALSLDAVAILGAEIMPKQALQINQLHKEVIVLPDRDRDGERTVAQAIELGWSVSLPDFGTAKDANDAVNTYGVLWTLQQIIQQRNASALKIKLASKAWFTRI